LFDAYKSCIKATYRVRSDDYLRLQFSDVRSQSGRGASCPHDLPHGQCPRLRDPDDFPLSRSYHVLGELRYTSPFSTDAIDSAQIAVRLKYIALAEYPDTVDAVIKANTQVVGADDTVVVTGEAVQFDTSADRNMMHNLISEDAIVSPK
jgi:hypothetical protein